MPYHSTQTYIIRERERDRELRRNERVEAYIDEQANLIASQPAPSPLRKRHAYDSMAQVRTAQRARATNRNIMKGCK